MSTDLREAEALLAQGVADYLAKPFDIDELLACVERCTSLWSSTIPRP
jgi:DNA-binding response OmpR family regulator